MTPIEADQLELARQTSKVRSAAFIAAIDPVLSAREDGIAVELAHENSSGKSKLGKLYRLLEDLSAVAKPFVACGIGCSDCCKMNVSVSEIEAERLANISGKPLTRVLEPTVHPIGRFLGVPCPFLVGNACSVYEARPYACRAHVSFDVGPYWCHPDRSHVDEMGMVEFSSAKEAYVGVVARSRLGGFADIRDFFPPERAG